MNKQFSCDTSSSSASGTGSIRERMWDHIGRKTYVNSNVVNPNYESRVARNTPSIRLKNLHSEFEQMETLLEHFVKENEKLKTKALKCLGGSAVLGKLAQYCFGLGHSIIPWFNEWKKMIIEKKSILKAQTAVGLAFGRLDKHLLVVTFIGWKAFAIHRQEEQVLIKELQLHANGREEMIKLHNQLQKEFQQLAEKKNQILNQVGEGKRQLEGLQGEVLRLTNRCTRQQKLLEQQAEENETLTEEANKLNDELPRLRISSQHEKTKNERLESRLQEEEKRGEKLQDLVKTCEDENVRLVKDNSTLTQQNVKIKKENEEKQHEITILIQKLTDAERCINNLRGEANLYLAISEPLEDELMRSRNKSDSQPSSAKRKSKKDNFLTPETKSLASRGTSKSKDVGPRDSRLDNTKPENKIDGSSRGRLDTLDPQPSDVSNSKNGRSSPSRPSKSQSPNHFSQMPIHKNFPVATQWARSRGKSPMRNSSSPQISQVAPGMYSHVLPNHPAEYMAQNPNGLNSPMAPLGTTLSMLGMNAEPARIPPPNSDSSSESQAHNHPVLQHSQSDILSVPSQGNNFARSSNLLSTGLMQNNFPTYYNPMNNQMRITSPASMSILQPATSFQEPVRASVKNARRSNAYGN